MLHDPSGGGVLLRVLSRYSRARAREIEGDLAGALEDLATIRGAGEGPGPTVRLRMAFLWQRMGNGDRAEAVFREALEETRRRGTALDWSDLCRACRLVAGVRKGPLVSPWFLVATEEAVGCHGEDPRLLALRSDALSAEGCPAEALAAVIKAKSLAPDMPYVLASLGFRLLEGKRYEEARREFDRALVLSSSAANVKSANVEFTAGRSLALHGLGKSEEALRDLRDTASRHPHDCQAQIALGMFLFEQMRDTAEAAETFRKAIRLQPDAADAHYNLGNVLNAERKWREAAEEFRQAIRLDSTQPSSHNNLGVALKNLGEIEEAIASFRRALDLNPRYGLAQFCLGTAFQDSGKLDEAIAAYQEAARIAPRDSRALVNMGRILRDRGDLDGAIEAGREAVRRRPDHDLAQGNLGNWLVEKGDVPGGIATLRKALQLNDKLGYFHRDLGLALRDSGDAEGAIAEFHAAIRCDAGDAVSHSHLGCLLRARSDLDGAANEFREAIRLKPEFSAAHYNLGNTLLDKGDNAGAEAGFRDAVRFSPDDPEARTNLGCVLLNRRKFDEAEKELRAVLKSVPDHFNARANLAIVFSNQGEYGKALPEYRRAHEIAARTADGGNSIAEQVAKCERLAALEARLEAIQRGDSKPVGRDELLGLAEVCIHKGLFAAAHGFRVQALAENPALAVDLESHQRYYAACEAALVAGGQARDAQGLDGPTRARWRRNAVELLQKDHALWTKRVESGTPEQRTAAREALKLWLTDPDLEGIRDEEKLGELPSDEQAACQALWASVRALLD